MRRVHIRGRENILKRLLIHVAGFNQTLVLRRMTGKGTPRGLQDLAVAYFLILIALINHPGQVLDGGDDSMNPAILKLQRLMSAYGNQEIGTTATGC